jgi:putative transposase
MQTTDDNKFGPQSRNLASIVRGYKIGVKKYATTNKIDFAWQARFHDHIIQNHDEYHRIHDYFIENPANWK